MRNLFLTLIFGITVIVSNAKNDEQCPLNTSLDKSLIPKIETMYMPYTESKTAEMRLVKTKGEYTIWKCPSIYVTKYPLPTITGRSYNYFVYKNGEFHLTVNEMNKEKVYLFFTDQIG